MVVRVVVVVGGQVVRGGRILVRRNHLKAYRGLRDVRFERRNPIND